ncbi:RAMP superfamily CRISPR-associated protein [Lipingzhangella sp. LS1_29]|uniref:RAMP superfamily CRISPR-associated protein n=1 Tax=Lipingzhangella rawalii TaxID=2055835 RepID=A0ABU2H6T4_9ACTN|nr:RAMP superfamily CRISPR-associated protein [Lipingzhangella rawalii]MDS1270692.1 RAMP superfamily CRISPR-associated protein [Lipingzhangella rawalii]
MTAEIDNAIRREFVAGPIRQPDTVWEVGLRLTLRSDTHIGAASPATPHAAAGDVDQLVDRDPQTGAPRLRATTLTGLLRHHLADKLGRENGEDPQGVNRLFGRIERRETPGRAEDRPVMSVLDVDDAGGTLPPAGDADGARTSEGPAVRTANRVDPRSGAVEAGKLWQMEVLPAGTSFVVTLRLQLCGDHDEVELLALLTRAVEGLVEEGPGVRLGARAARGLGAVRAEAFSARRHDLRTPQGWADYYARTWHERWEEAKGSLAGYSDGLQGAITAALAEEGRAGYEARLAELPADQRRRAELHLTLEVGERPTEAFLGNGSGAGEDGPPRPGVILLGDLPRGAARDTDADRAHRMRPVVAEDGAVRDAPMFGDTALFALVKRIGRRLAQDLRGDDLPRHHPWLAGWFGSEPETETPDRAPVTSRVTLRQAPRIEGGSALSTTRTTIDALFADTVDGRLFTDRAWAGGTSTFVLDVREPDDAVCALLALIVRELHTVPFDAIGGGTGVGHGRVTATDAQLVRFGPDRAEPDTLDLLAVLRDPGHERRAEVEGWLAELEHAVQRDNDTTEAVA